MLIISGQNVFGQSTVFQTLNTNYNTLNAAQKANYDKMITQGVYKPDIKFISYNSEAISDTNGLLKLGLGLYLDSFEFKSTIVNYQSPNDFNWRGEYYNYTDSTAENTYGVLSFLAHDGRIFGTMEVEDRSYQIYDLTGGVLVLAEYKMDAELNCGVNDGTPVNTHDEVIKTCQSNRMKILVIYTQKAADEEPDTWGKALHGVNQLAQVWSNSVYNSGGNYIYPELAGVEVVDLPEGVHSYLPNPYDVVKYELNDYSNNTIVNNLRSTYNADIVIFVTRQLNDYGSINGYAKEIGVTDPSQAYALVTLTNAVNGRRVFVHEVNHLFGGAHQDDYRNNNPEYAHAYMFYQNWKRRFTIMYNPIPKNKIRIDNVSNPFVNFNNKPTGIENTNFNMKRVVQFTDYIASIYSDIVPFSVQIVMNGLAKCSQNGTATVTFPEECKKDRFFTYQWQYSDNGVSWTNVTGGATQTINTFVPYPNSSTMNGTFNTRQYKVVVSSAAYGTSTAYGTAYFVCPSFPPLGTISAKMSNNTLFKVYPNPANNNFQIDFVLSKDENVTIQVLDVNGREVKKLFNESLAKGAHQLKFDEKLVSGLYFIRFKKNQDQFFEKLIIK